VDDERKINGCEASTDPSRCTARGTEFRVCVRLCDDWEHDLLLEAILQPDPNIPYPRCIAGERNCPPEDVGGSDGYENYLVALADPEDEEHETCSRGVVRSTRKHFRSPPSTSNSRRSSTPSRENRPAHSGTTQSCKKVAGQIRHPCCGLWWAVSGIPPKDRTRIHRNEKVPLELNDRERKLIQWHTSRTDVDGPFARCAKARRTSSLSLYLG